MPRRSILSSAERDGVLMLPDAKDELIRLYTFNDADLAIIQQHRGPANRLGFAVQLCYMRHPGILLAASAELFAPLLRMVAAQNARESAYSCGADGIADERALPTPGRTAPAQGSPEHDLESSAPC